MKTKASKIRSMHPRNIIDVLINRGRLYHFLGPQGVMTKNSQHCQKACEAKAIIPYNHSHRVRSKNSDHYLPSNQLW